VRSPTLGAIRPQAHIAASLVIWSASPAPAWEAPVCAACGNLPDLDRSVARRLGVKRRDHHRWVSHSFAGWCGPTALAFRAARGTRWAGPVNRGLLSLWTHLLLDTYADGIAWLWPLSEEKIGLFRGPPSSQDRGWRTRAPLDSELGRAEAAMWVTFAVALSLRRGAR
jgi:LexA-binding, inner membrane-associated putative hydrolase